MVARRVEAVKEVIKAKRHHSQRPVGFVTLLLPHRRALNAEYIIITHLSKTFFIFSYPEIVVKQIPPRRLRSQILVVLDGSHVVEDEAAVQGVPVEDRTHRHEESVGEIVRMKIPTIRNPFENSVSLLFRRSRRWRRRPTSFAKARSRLF